MVEVTENQKTWLRKFGVSDEELKDMNKDMATAALSVYFIARKLVPASREKLRGLVAKALDNCE